MRKPFVFLWFVLTVTVLFVWIYLPVLTKYRDLKSQDDEIASELAMLNDKIRELQEERHLLKHDVTYLEKVIRDELGLVRPGETVYKFVTDPALNDPEPASETAEQAIPLEG